LPQPGLELGTQHAPPPPPDELELAIELLLDATLLLLLLLLLDAALDETDDCALVDAPVVEPDIEPADPEPLLGPGPLKLA